MSAKKEVVKPKITYDILSSCCQVPIVRLGKLHYECPKCKKDVSVYMLCALQGQIKRKYLWLKPKEHHNEKE